MMPNIKESMKASERVLQMPNKGDIAEEEKLRPNLMTRGMMKNNENKTPTANNMLEEKTIDLINCRSC